MSLTQRQIEIRDAYSELGNKAAVARKLGITRAAVRHQINILERKGEASWYSGAIIPEHLKQVKTTVQYDGEGRVIQEWKRLVPQASDFEEFVAALCETVKGIAKPSAFKPAKHVSTGTLFEIVIADAHIGLYASGEETRDSDYDCDIAKKRMIDAVKYHLSRAGKPEKIVLAFTGDTQHSDTRNNTTEKSGHNLDVDTRFQRVIDYVVAACSECVQMASKVAPDVEVVIVKGNHDWHSAVWLMRVLEATYSKCDNVTINMQRSARKAITWGDNLLVWTHGDGISAQKWGQIIPAEFPKEWGATKYRFLKMGHIHHKKTIAPVVVDEQCGLHVEFVEALTSMDSWTAESGFVGSVKGASAFEYHKEKGLMGRYYYNI